MRFFIYILMKLFFEDNNSKLSSKTKINEIYFESTISDSVKINSGT